MARLPFLGSICVVALCCGALPACGQQDEAQTLIAKCGEPPPDQVDSCLEQARVLDETDPSKDSKALMAHLIQLQVEQRSKPEQIEAGTPPSDDNAVAPPEPPPTSPDLGNGTTYESPPDAQDETPPAVQGDPADADQNDTDTPPPPPPDNMPPPQSTAHATQQPASPGDPADPH